MAETQLKLTAQEMEFVIHLIKQVSVSPAHPDALLLVTTSQSILAKIAEAQKGEA
jgi:hypothetical protein